MTDLTLADERPPAHETHFDPAALDALVEALATVEDASPTELAPLHDAVDVDALTQFVRRAAAAPRSSTTSVEVSLERWTVRVDSDGRLLVYEPASPTAPDY